MIEQVTQITLLTDWALNKIRNRDEADTSGQRYSGFEFSAPFNCKVRQWKFSTNAESAGLLGDRLRAAFAVRDSALASPDVETTNPVEDFSR
jgi:hypothetical protein